MTTTMTTLAPSAIKPNPINPRHALNDIEDLTASIKANGVLEPLIVAPNGTYDTYVLIAGHRRLAAATAAKVNELPCIVRDDLDTPAKQLEAMLVENTQREDLTPLDEARGYQALLDFPGYTQAKVAKAVGRSVKTVRGRLAITKLPDKTTAKLESGEITLHDAEVLLSFTGDAKAYNAVAKAIGTHQFNYEVEKQRSDMKKRAADTKMIDAAKAAGVTVVDGKPYDKRPGVAVADIKVGGLWSGKPLFKTPAEHASCPHHALYLNASYAGRPAFYCTKPTSHPEAQRKDAGGKPGSDPAAEAEAKAAQEQEDALEVAAKVRLDWVRDQLTGKTAKPKRDATLAMLRRVATLESRLFDAEGMAPLLGLTEDDDDAAYAELLDIIATGGQDRLIQVMFVLSSNVESWMTTPNDWDASVSWNSSRATFDLLVALGYKPSDIEAELAGKTSEPA